MQTSVEQYLSEKYEDLCNMHQFFFLVFRVFHIFSSTDIYIEAYQTTLENFFILHFWSVVTFFRRTAISGRIYSCADRFSLMPKHSCVSSKVQV